MEGTEEDEFRNYRLVTYAEMADWNPDFDMTGVSVEAKDMVKGSPQLGDKIARHPNDYNDRWLISAEDFRHNFRPL